MARIVAIEEGMRKRREAALALKDQEPAKVGANQPAKVEKKKAAGNLINSSDCQNNSLNFKFDFELICFNFKIIFIRSISKYFYTRKIFFSQYCFHRCHQEQAQVLGEEERPQVYCRRVGAIQKQKRVSVWIRNHAFGFF